MLEFCKDDEKHFHHEIRPDELHEICFRHIDKIKLLLKSLIKLTKEDKKIDFLGKNGMYKQFIKITNAIKRTFIIVIILFIFQPKIVLGKILPEQITEKNQEASLIVIGEVYDTGAAILFKNDPEKPLSSPLNRFIILKVVHVIKGGNIIKPESLIHILAVDDPKKQQEENKKAEKDFPFQTEKGLLIIVYADPVPDKPGFYRPLFGEKSVFTIGRSF